jgi:hypothetical protein
MKRIYQLGAITIAVTVLAGCERASGASAAVAPSTASVDSVRLHVDTVHAPEVALVRFRESLAEAETLTGGESSVEGLVARWVAAVETQDTSTLRQLVIDRAEYAWLYYPASTFSRRPLYQPPEIFWFRLQASSEKGIVRVLRRLGGSSMNYRGVRCPRPPRIEGANRIWEYCAVQRSEGSVLRSDILFGGILEREGRFKFIGYGNQY